MTEKKTKNLKAPENKNPSPGEDKDQIPNHKIQIPNKSQIPNNNPQIPSPISPLSREERKTGEREKTSFYARVLEEAERLDFETAAKTEGLDEEITLIRVKIKKLLESDPNNVRLLVSATKILVSLVKARYSMNKKQEKNLGEAIKNVIRDIGVPLGVAALNKKL
jgi:hypothetical protein